MSVRLRSLGYALLALAVTGAAVYWSGVVSISASSGHWAITDLFLHTAMRRSVKFHASGIVVPEDLATEAHIRRGAGHFESSCAPCHGSPARSRGAVPLGMTPSPPSLAPQVVDWEPEHLFWIIKHGVKFSGMPAWPTLARDDEVWAMTAFLLALPGMSADRYLALAYGEQGSEGSAPGALSLAARPPLADCRRCHGREGLGEPNAAFPRLDIQTADYLLGALRAYRSGARKSGFMQSAAAPLEDAELVALAEHYAQGGPVAPAPIDPGAVPPAMLARGEAIARHGIPADGVGACLGCHGPSGRPDFPRIAGQYPDYLETQLALFASEARRGGAAFVELMSTASHALAPDDIAAVSAWFASRDPRAALASSRAPRR